MTERDRRALKLGAAAVAAAILFVRVLPWAGRRALAARLELQQRAAILARARADLAETALLRDSAAALGRALVGLAPKLLTGPTAAEAAADLSGRLSHAAARNRARVERLDQMPDSATAGALRRVRVRATLETDIRGVAGALRAVEFGEAALTVTEIRIAALDPAPSDPGRAPERLRFELTAAGWFLADSGRATATGARSP
jgi:hypothetical protein